MILPKRALLGLRPGGRKIYRDPQKVHRYRCSSGAAKPSPPPNARTLPGVQAHELVTTIVILLAYGCPVQAIVAALDLDKRTIHRWQHESGRQCRRVHEHIVQAGGVLLAQVQADELRVGGRGRGNVAGLGAFG